MTSGTSSLLPTLTMFYPAHTLGPTCSTKWNTHSSAGGGRSRNRESLCLTVMSFSVKRLQWVKQNKTKQKNVGKLKKKKEIHCDCDRALCVPLLFSYLSFFSSSNVTSEVNKLKTGCGCGVSFEILLFSASARD